MISSSQRFSGCSAECLEGSDTFVVSVKQTGMAKKEVLILWSRAERALLQSSDVWKLHQGTRREQREL